METKTNPPPGLKKVIISRVLIFLVVLMAIFFIPAGTLRYWQAWLYIGILLIPAMFVLTYIYKHTPDLLERRMRYKEKREKQKAILTFVYPLYLLIFIIPGLDKRYGWSSVPVLIVLLSGLVCMAGFYLFFRVVKENRYASRIIEIDENQKVIQTGPYAVIRHPMYLSTLIIYFISPLVLGSYWALIPLGLVIPFLVFRILDEEKVLRTGLSGYVEYCEKVRFRLIPGVW